MHCVCRKCSSIRGKEYKFKATNSVILSKERERKKKEVRKVAELKILVVSCCCSLFNRCVTFDCIDCSRCCCHLMFSCAVTITPGRNYKRELMRAIFMTPNNLGAHASESSVVFDSESNFFLYFIGRMLIYGISVHDVREGTESVLPAKNIKRSILFILHCPF